MELMSSSRVLKEIYKNEFHDINSNGSIERLHCYNLPTNAAIIAYSQNESTYGSWNLPGHWYTQPDYKLYDHDEDGVSELYGLSINNGDSLFVSQVHLIKAKREIKTKFISHLQKYNGEIDMELRAYGFADITGDSIDDYIFFSSAGFPLQPRTYYAWDIKNDTIIRGPIAGMNYRNRLLNLSENIDMETGEEIFLVNGATNNYRTSITYSDTASYAVVFTKNLNYLFQPVYCAGAQSVTYTIPFVWENNKQVLAITRDPRKIENKTKFRIINLQGDVIFEKQTSLFDTFFKLMMANNSICLETHKNSGSEFGILNEDLIFVKKIAFKENFYVATAFNADDDSRDEFLFINGSKNEIGILQDDYKGFTYVETPNPITEFRFVSLKSFKNGSSIISIQMKGHEYLYNYKKSKIYPFRIIYYILTYLLTYLFLIALQKIFAFRSNRKKVLEEKMTNYQLQSIMNQLNPHFTFNAINSIGGAIIDGKNVEAYEYFTKLSNLVRKSMTNAFQTYKTLGEEIDFVKEYLEIEKYRFEEKLNWELSIDPSVDMRVEVPKMLIHIFVENAIKHGIFHMTRSGNIDIKILNNNSHLEIFITDDGVGMSKAFEIEQHKGKGLMILNNYLELFNVKQKSNISYKIKDRSKINKEIKGTEVIIKIS